VSASHADQIGGGSNNVSVQPPTPLFCICQSAWHPYAYTTMHFPRFLEAGPRSLFRQAFHIAGILNHLRYAWNDTELTSSPAMRMCLAPKCDWLSVPIWQGPASVPADKCRPRRSRLSTQTRHCRMFGTSSCAGRPHRLLRRTACFLFVVSTHILVVIHARDGSN
jgi:hypothetical protein